VNANASTTADQTGSTTVDYMYADADGNKRHTEATFPGVITDAERARLIAATIGGHFWPAQIGLSDPAEDMMGVGAYDPTHCTLTDVTTNPYGREFTELSDESIHAFVRRVAGHTWERVGAYDVPAGQRLTTSQGATMLPRPVEWVVRNVAAYLGVAVSRLFVATHDHEGLRPGAFSIAFEGSDVPWPVHFTDRVFSGYFPDVPANIYIEPGSSWYLAVYPPEGADSIADREPGEQTPAATDAGPVVVPSTFPTKLTRDSARTFVAGLDYTSRDILAAALDHGSVEDAEKRFVDGVRRVLATHDKLWCTSWVVFPAMPGNDGHEYAIGSALVHYGEEDWAPEFWNAGSGRDFTAAGTELAEVSYLNPPRAGGVLVVVVEGGYLGKVEHLAMPQYPYGDPRPWCEECGEAPQTDAQTDADGFALDRIKPSISGLCTACTRRKTHEQSRNG
jgi:hypothetical protein